MYIIYMKRHRISLPHFSVSWKQDYLKTIHKGSIIHGRKCVINVKEIISKQKAEYYKMKLKCAFYSY